MYLSKIQNIPFQKSKYRVSHLRNSFFKGPKMSENQYVDKKKDGSIITKPHHLTYNL